MPGVRSQTPPTRAVTDFRPRDSKSSPKECNRKHSQHKRVFQLNVHCPQKRWRLETDNQCQVPQFLPGSLSFQNGGHRKLERCVTGRRLYGKDRPRGCLPFSASSSGTSRFPEVLLETKNIPVQIPPIRTGYSTKSLHENSAAPRSKDENDRFAYHRLSGRYVGHGTVSREVDVTYADSCQGVAGTGFQAESQEMCLGTSASNRVSGFPSELENNEDLSAGGKDSESDEGVQTHNQQEVSDSSTPGSFDRAVVIDSTSNQCGTPPLSKSSEVAPKSSAEFPRKLRSRDCGRRRGRSGSPMVGRTRARIRRSPSCPPLGRHDTDNRCLKIWLGSNRSGKKYREYVDSGREESPHKLPRDESSSTGLANLCLDKTEYSHPVADRQLISHCIHKPQRGNAFQSPVRFGSRDLGVVFDSQDNNSCGTHSRSVQHCSGCRVETEFRAKRLEATQGSFRSTSESMGSSQCGPVCSEAQQTTASLFQLQTRPGSGGSGCPGSVLVGSESLCFSPICSDREMPSEVGAGKGERTGVDSTSVAQPNMVSNSSDQAHRPADLVARLEKDYHKSSWGDTPIDREKQLAPGRLQSFRSSIQEQGISDESFRIISAAWRKGTEKSYSSAWGKWLLWCSRTNTNPFPSSIGPVLDFLTKQFQEGKQYTTLNSYRSALSATLHHIDGRPVGQHPIVCRLLQGMFNERPPAPRYQQVWDISLVVRYFQAGQPTSELTLKELSKKLVTLLALCNASRASDIRALDVRFRQSTGEGVKFVIPGLTKHVDQGHQEKFSSRHLMRQIPCAQ